MAEPKGGIGKEEWGITEIATQSRVFHLGDEDDSHGDSAQASITRTVSHVRFTVDPPLPPVSEHPDQADAPAAMTRQHSQRSLHSMTSGNEATLTYFSHSRPRDPNAALAVQFQESAEAVRLRRLTKQPTGSKLEPMKSFTDTLLERIQSTSRPSFARPSLASVSSRLRFARKPRRDDEFVDREVRTDAHQVTLEVLAGRLGSNTDTGLSLSEARMRLSRDGPNALTPPKAVPKWKLMMRELLSPFAIVLWCAAILCFVAFVVQAEGGKQTPGTQKFENLIVGVALILVVVITALFSFWQTVKSTDAMAGFAKMAPQSCVVIRDSEKMTISPRDLVCGDLVEVKSGDNIPADLRIVRSTQMKVDNSALTGESEPQSRSVYCTNDNPLETANLAFSGTSVVDGSGQGIVIHTGDSTVIGQLAGLVSGVQQEETPLNKEISRFVLYITIVAFILAIIFLAAGFARGDYWPSLLVIVIGIVVGTVPEGLPSAVAVSLALAAKRMAAKNVLVTEQLAVVETLGRTTVIASDKTGTLTQNRMTVSHVWCDGRMVDVRSANEEAYLKKNDVANESGEQGGHIDVSQWMQHTDTSSFNQLYLISALCSRAVFESESGNDSQSQEEAAIGVVESEGKSANGKAFSVVEIDMVDSESVPVSLRKVIGDASESGILRFCEELKPVADTRTTHPKVVEFPFNSTNKYQVSVHETRDHGNADYMVVMKGAPERIVSRCTHFTSNGATKELTDDVREVYEAAYEHMGGLGERVLGFCLRYLPRDQYPQGHEFSPDLSDIKLDGMTFVGLLSMIDPPRDSVPAALQTCKRSGIKVAMVTGDHPRTAAAIARKIGLLTPAAEAEGRSVVIHGDKLRDMSDMELDIALTHDEIVFARTSPAQKLRIVEGLQRAGHIVAVTGDGVNDSPALKQANVGVAMGIAGTDVSKDASDIILLDDNFGSIVNGIAEGRVIFDNLKKSIAYTLSSKFPQLLPYILSFFLYLPPPLNALLILSIDIGTDLLPAISLAYEQAESNVMKRNPRGDRHRDRLVNVPSILYSYAFLGTIQAIAGFCSYFLIFYTGAGINAGGFGFSQLWLTQGKDFVTSDAPIADATGVLWTLEQRLDLAQTASTAYFATLLHVRVWVLLTCKTVERSLFKHGLRGNKMLLIGCIQIIVIPFVLAYVPGIQWLFHTAALPWYTWLISLPFGATLLALDEGRKAIIRNNKRNALGEFFRY